MGNFSYQLVVTLREVSLHQLLHELSVPLALTIGIEIRNILYFIPLKEET